MVPPTSSPPPVWAAVSGVAVLAGRRLATGGSTVGELVTAADLPFAAFVVGLAVVVAAVLRAGLATGIEAVLGAVDQFLDAEEIYALAQSLP